MAAFIPALISGGAGLLTNYFKRNAQKKAATEMANAYQYGATAASDSRERNVHRIEDSATAAGTNLAEQTGQAEDATRAAGDKGIGIVNQGTTDANARLGDLLTQEKSNLDPYLTMGKTGADRYTDLMTNPQTALENTPGYQFNLQQGLKGVQGASSARGTLQSGGTLKALEGYGAGLASTTYQDAIKNALAGSQQGLTATSDYNSGLETLGGKQATNTLNNSVYAANVGNNVATRTGDLGIDWAKTQGNWNTDAAKTASGFDETGTNNIINLLLGKSGVTAGGTLAANQSTNNMIGAGGSTLQAFLQYILGKGGGGGSGTGNTYPAGAGGAGGGGGFP